MHQTSSNGTSVNRHEKWVRFHPGTKVLVDGMVELGGIHKVITAGEYSLVDDHLIALETAPR